ncbi:hypothetical protein ACH4CE_08335 [Streptomyces gelaticus]|uniref:hypothetical protein n=1 Tax=Streptomyces gelaticus TaxID=285446 RepID=UPI00379899D2
MTAGMSRRTLLMSAAPAAAGPLAAGHDLGDRQGGTRGAVIRPFRHLERAA